MLRAPSTHLKGIYVASKLSLVQKLLVMMVLWPRWVTYWVWFWMWLWLASYWLFIFSVASSKNDLGYQNSHASLGPPERIVVYWRNCSHWVRSHACCFWFWQHGTYGHWTKRLVWSILFVMKLTLFKLFWSCPEDIWVAFLVGDGNLEICGDFIWESLQPHY